MASSRVCAPQLSLALARHYRNNVVIITSMNRQTISWICQGKAKKTPKTSQALHPAAGCTSLVEHLCKHKTSSSALSGLQQNVSSEQALNQLCLAPGGTLCWSYVGLSLIAHDRVATSKFKKVGASNPLLCKVKSLHDESEQHLTHITYMYRISSLSLLYYCPIRSRRCK